MVPALFWLLATVAAAVLTGMRVQVLLLEHAPDAGMLAASAGLVVAGLILAAGLAMLFTLRSLRRTVLVLLIVPMVVLLAVGTVALRHPAGAFKDAGTAAEWRELHPTLRLALWVAAAQDRRLVVTDIARTSQGYEDMGLATSASSQHSVEPDRYARAMDLRVSDSGPLRNWARQGLFLLMGLETLRHEGTADHLHVSLPQRRALHS